MLSIFSWKFGTYEVGFPLKFFLCNDHGYQLFSLFFILWIAWTVKVEFIKMTLDNLEVLRPRLHLFVAILRNLGESCFILSFQETNWDGALVGRKILKIIQVVAKQIQRNAARKGLSMDDPISFHPALFSQTLSAGNEVEEFSSSDQEENPN